MCDSFGPGGRGRVPPPPRVLCACVVIQYCKNIDYARAHPENTTTVVELGRGRRRLWRDGWCSRVKEPSGEGIDSTIGVEIRRHGRLLLRSATTRRIVLRVENRFPSPSLPDDSYIYNGKPLRATYYALCVDIDVWSL